MELFAIGAVASPLTDRAAAPKQADEGAPAAWLVFDEAYAAGLEGIAAGDDVDGLEALDGTPIVDIKPVLGDER